MGLISQSKGIGISLSFDYAVSSFLSIFTPYVDKPYMNACHVTN